MSDDSFRRFLFGRMNEAMRKRKGEKVVVVEVKHFGETVMKKELQKMDILFRNHKKCEEENDDNL